MRWGSVSARRAAALLALVAGWAFFHAAVLFSPRVPYYRDLLMTHLPLVHYLHERLREGSLPQWYPFESMGEPFIGQIISATFHPQSLLFLLPLPAPVAVKWNICLDFLAGLLGAYRLCRALPASRPASLAGAAVFGFGGYTLSMSNNLPYLTGLVTLPWVGWAAVRLTRRWRWSDAVVLAVAWALVLLGGDAQSFALSPVIAVGLGWSTAAPASMGRGAKALRAGAVVGLTGLLAAVQLLPSAVQASVSLRSLGAPDPGHGLTWALHPLRLASFAVQRFVPGAARGAMVEGLFGGGHAFWATSIFVGALAIGLAILGGVCGQRQGWILGGLALAFVWLALGRHGGLLPLAWRLLPPLAQFRFPEKYLAGFMVSLAALVALGADRAGRTHWAWAALGAPAAILLLVGLWAPWTDLVERLFTSFGHPLPAGDPASLIIGGAWALGLVSAAAFLLLAAGAAGIARTRPAAIWAIPVLVFAELYLGNVYEVPTVPPGVLRTNSLIDAASRAPGDGAPPDRVIPALTPVVRSTVTDGNGSPWVRASLLAMHPDAAAPWGVDSFGENLPGTSYREAVMFGRGGLGLDAMAPRFDGCMQVVDPRHRPAGVSTALAIEPKLGIALAQGPCRPRAFLAAAEPVADLAAAVAAQRPDLAPRVVWEGGPPRPLAEGAVSWELYSPELLRLRAHADRETALVVSDLFSSGWTATLDGAPTPIYAADVVARGIALPAGDHEVAMTYRTPGLALGGCLSFAGLVLGLGLIVLGRRWDPAAPASA